MRESLPGKNRSTLRFGDSGGLFADVSLVVTRDESSEDEGSGFFIRTTEPYPSADYPTTLYASAAFGISYAIERLPLDQQKSIRSVTIDLIKHHPVDTNSLIVAFAAANAVWNALGVTIPNSSSFDESSGAFIFPIQDS